MNMESFLTELEIYTKYFSPEALKFFNELKEQTENNENKKFTESGKKILKCMQDNNEKYLNIFSSKQIGELLFMPPRSVSGSMKKLLNEGYVEKKSRNPVTYGITDLGKAQKLDN